MAGPTTNSAVSVASATGNEPKQTACVDSFEMLVQRLDDNAEQRDAFARAFKRREAAYTELRMGGYKRSVLKLNSMTKDEAVELAITRVSIAIRCFKRKF